MTKRPVYGRGTRALTPGQVRALRARRDEAARLTRRRIELREELRAINAALPPHSYAALAREFGISSRTVEAIATFHHYKEVR